MVPSQYLIGAFMLILSGNVNNWLGIDGSEPQIALLTAAFFALNFLAATQDIAVDGWALTMLKRFERLKNSKLFYLCIIYNFLDVMLDMLLHVIV